MKADLTIKLPKIKWTDVRLDVITQMHLGSAGDSPDWTVVHCHGRLTNGTLVEVELPFNKLPKKGIQKAIVDHAKRDHVNAKDLCVFASITNVVWENEGCG